jgi:hypothetical protein
MNKLEIKTISELYKQQYTAYRLTGFTHTYDTLKGIRQILSALQVNTISLENEIDIQSMHTYESMAYETIQLIFNKYHVKPFNYNYDDTDIIFDNLQFSMSESDQTYVKRNLSLIKEYHKSA